MVAFIAYSKINDSSYVRIKHIYLYNTIVDKFDWLLCVFFPLWPFQTLKSSPSDC